MSGRGEEAAFIEASDFAHCGRKTKTIAHHQKEG